MKIVSESFQSLIQVDNSPTYSNGLHSDAAREPEPSTNVPNEQYDPNSFLLSNSSFSSVSGVKLSKILDLNGSYSQYNDRSIAFSPQATETTKNNYLNGNSMSGHISSIDSNRVPSLFSSPSGTLSTGGRNRRAPDTKSSVGNSNVREEGGGFEMTDSVTLELSPDGYDVHGNGMSREIMYSPTSFLRSPQPH